MLVSHQHEGWLLEATTLYNICNTRLWKSFHYATFVFFIMLLLLLITNYKCYATIASLFHKQNSFTIHWVYIHITIEYGALHYATQK